jgi:hypothetical protein
MSRLAPPLACVPILLSLLGSAAWSEGTEEVTPAAPEVTTSSAGAEAEARPAVSTSPTVSEVLQARRAAKAVPVRRRPSMVLAQASTEGSAEAPAAEESKPEPPKLEISGFVDWYYEYNFNRPSRFVSDGAGGNVRNEVQNELRNFDFKHNEFALNLAEVVIQRAPAPVGFRIDLDFGKATDWVHSVEPGGAETYKHIQQAYLTVPTKFWGKDDTLDVGKFVTHHGAEVIETKDNWNYTRSLLFAWAIPYYHAGLRYRHAFSPTSGITLHVVNGWNNVEDNNNSPSFGLLYNTALGKKLSLIQNYMGGPELTNDNHNWRHLFDTVLTYNATDKTSYMLNYDYMTEDRDNGDVHWQGIAGYVRHALTDRNAVVLRGEWFKDEDGASTGTSQEVKEVTLTYEIKGPGGLLTRAELRHDWSNKAVFDDSDSGKKKSQTTLLLGAVYSF